MRPSLQTKHSFDLRLLDVDVTIRHITKADLKEVHRILMEWGTSYQDIVDIYALRQTDICGAFLSHKSDQIVGKPYWMPI